MLANEPQLPAEVDRYYPLQLFGGLHYLVLSGQASWDDVPAALRDEWEFLAEWVSEERVQTNEVARCWWLLPCFLEVARRRGVDAFHCVELGCSGGLNLVWDGYGYDYAAGGYPGEPMLAGEERVRPVPLGPLPCVLSRVGVDQAPPDLRTDEGVRLLKSFVWAGQDERLARLDAAVEVWRRNPPEIVVGDMLDDLPGLLERGEDGLAVVWQTAALNYLPAERQAQVRELLRTADDVAFIETALPTDGCHDYYGLVVDGIEVAFADFHGAWIEWRG